ncbi:SOS response-associated peptidase [Chitinasiproducens palmae]|uniref:Abasic site processing protein n=1 Tax=Chitinasiproducens palmae TaxID=1770053 RepID=A0A1H2PVJ8_9BURK|nr:SOS response-associated peptidase [Chitinasiproducens palmae]SDV50475.1 Putative SOS response-associated peptidase YedK [Chitinasiproducens palmae]
MCGRFSRSRTGVDYVEPLMTDDRYRRWSFDLGMFRRSWNIAPGTRQVILKPDGARLEFWGYRPFWAVTRDVPMMINARLDKAQSSTWKRLFNAGRCLIPADGWYEWVTERSRKQPYYIQPKASVPLYFAGLSSVATERRETSSAPASGTVDGFVIVTDAAAGGMLDVHDRRPLVLNPEEAMAWLDPDTSFEEATHIANNARTRATDFRWFRVTPQVNRSGVGNDDPSFSLPLERDDDSSNRASDGAHDKPRKHVADRRGDKAPDDREDGSDGSD